MKSSQEYQYFKLNRDDILSIVKDYLANEVTFKDGHTSTLNFMGNNEGIRIVAVFGDIDSTNIEQIDLEEIDKKIEFNGPWSTIPPEGFINNLSSEEIQDIVKKSKNNLFKKIWKKFKS